MSNAEQRINLAASKLAIWIPFIGTIFSGMRRSIDNNQPTACVKGMHVKFNEKFVDALSNEALLFVCAHETYHTALLHSYRVGDRDRKIWNVAGDAVINPELIRAGLTMPVWDAKLFAVFPEAVGKAKVGENMGVLYKWVTEELSTEDVYKKLMEDAESQGKSGGWGDSGDLEAADGGDSEGEGESEAEVKVMITQAARTAFASGDKSAMVQRVLGNAQQSNTDWKDETRSMLMEQARNDYSYRRFNRRFIGQGVYLPSLYSEELGALGIGIDTSGSMTDDQLAAIQVNVNNIIEDCAPSKTIVVYCDSSINRVDVFPKGTAVQLKMCGGGGTDMRKITKYFDDSGERLAGVIVFTDMDTPFPTEEPPYTLLWGAVNARQSVSPPVGRRVEVRV